MPSNNAECRVSRCILNAATPVGAVNSTVTSSGCISLERCKSFMVYL